jgi:hypothetical protein
MISVGMTMGDRTLEEACVLDTTAVYRLVIGEPIQR